MCSFPQTTFDCFLFEMIVVKKLRLSTHWEKVSPTLQCSLNEYFVVVLNNQAKVDNKEMFGVCGLSFRVLIPVLLKKVFQGYNSMALLCQYFTV